MQSYNKLYCQQARLMIARMVEEAQKDSLSPYELGVLILDRCPWRMSDFRAHQAWMRERYLAVTAYREGKTIEEVEQEGQERLKQEYDQRRQKRHADQMELL